MQAEGSRDDLHLVVEVLFEGAAQCLGSAGVDAVHPADVAGEAASVEEFGQSACRGRLVCQSISCLAMWMAGGRDGGATMNPSRRTGAVDLGPLEQFQARMDIVMPIGNWCAGVT